MKRRRARRPRALRPLMTRGDGLARRRSCGEICFVIIGSTTVAAFALIASAHGSSPASHPVSVVATDVRQADGQAVAFASAAGRVLIRRDDGRQFPAVVPPNCRFAAAGAGHLLWSCGRDLTTNTQSLIVTDLKGRGGMSIQGPSVTGADATVVAYDRIGAQWLQARVSGYHYATTLYLNWRTGEQRGGRLDADAFLAPSLGSRSLHRRLCRPLERRAAPDPGPAEAIDPLLPMEYRPPWAASPYGGTVVLQRCGSRRTFTVPNVDSTSWVVGSSWLAWQDSSAGRIRLRSLRDQRDFSVRPKVAQGARLALTRRNLYIVGAPGEASATARRRARLQSVRPRWARAIARLRTAWAARPAVGRAATGRRTEHRRTAQAAS
jgi:hypothetical protein